MAKNTDKSEACEGGPRRGRPPKGSEESRRKALLAAAEEVFLEKGLAASMDDIAKRAGVSKKTIYGCSETKEKLFADVMHTRIENSMVSELPDSVANAQALEDALVQFFTELSRFVLSPVSVRLYRAVTAEATRFPELARTYYEEGPAHVIDILGKWLAARARDGIIALENPSEAAAILGSSVIAGPLRNLALGVGGTPTTTSIEQRARTTAQFFLRGALTDKARAKS